MRRYPVTVNPYMPATHTGQAPDVPRRQRRRVRPVLPAGQITGYAGSSGTFSGASSGGSADPMTEPASGGEECCG